MITFSISYDTILFSLLGLLAMLVVIMAVALWLDYRAGVFTPELEPCFMCGEPSDKFLCKSCAYHSSLDGDCPDCEVVAVHEYKFENFKCKDCGLETSNPYALNEPCEFTYAEHTFH